MLRTTQSLIQVLVADPTTTVRETQNLVQTLQDDPTPEIRYTTSIVTVLDSDPITDIRVSGQFLQVLVSDEPFIQEDLTFTELAEVVEEGDEAEDILFVNESNSVQTTKQVFADANDTLSPSDIAFSFVVVPIFASASDNITLTESNTVIQGTIQTASSDDTLTFSESNCVAECSQDGLTLVENATADSEQSAVEGVDNLTFLEVATASLTYCESVSESLTTTTQVFDPATLTFSTVTSGLSEVASDGSVAGIDLGAIESLGCTERAVGWIIPPGPVDTATDNLNLGEFARIGENADRTEAISLTELATAIVSVNAFDSLVLTDEAISCHDGTSTASDTLNLAEAFSVCVTPGNPTVCDLKNYNPQEGSKSLGTYPDAVDTGFKLTGVVSGTTVELPDPNLGNRYRFTPQRINTESRGGTLTIFSDPIWPKVRTQQFTFSGMKKDKVLELQTFIDTHLGVLVNLVDHEGRLWQGIIVVVDDPIVEDRKNSWTGSFEFEGDLV